MEEKIQTISPLVDQFSRTISYLRLSVTDRCNLRCIYCMPGSKQDSKEHFKKKKYITNVDLLTYEELLRIVRLAVSLGMSKIRLTGGEPLVRREIMGFIERLSNIAGLEQIRLTTNGVLLGEYAEQLYLSGIRHINVSLDTLNPLKFTKITGRDYFKQVWQGLSLAAEMGFRIKLNVVAMRGVNDDEFLDFANLSMQYPFQVRFIEYMPVGEKNSWKKKQFIKGEEIADKIRNIGELHPCKANHGDGPARMYKLRGRNGECGNIGFISPISHHFCDNCNRLRLTSEGKLRACLLKEYETDMKRMLRTGATDDTIVESIRQTILNKPQGHSLQSELEVEKQASCGGRMSRIGG